MTKLVKTLLNGVEMFEMNIQNDFDEAQEMFYQAEYLNEYTPKYAFNDRVKNNFVGTYKFKVERTKDYRRFIDMLENERRNTPQYQQKNTLRSDSRSRYWNDAITETQYLEELQKIEIMTFDTPDKQNAFRLPTLEEWKSGKYQESEKRSLRLGKALLKAGFTQTTIDFYSQQIKTENERFITISDKIQHITGMSAYVDLENHRWNGYNNSSCQDPRHDYEDGIHHLVGALHDDKLFIAMMHDELEDVEDMTDKLRARTLLRLIHVDGEQVLVSTEYYGNNTTENELIEGLKQLHEVNIFETTNRYNDVEEDANGFYTGTVTDDLYICEEIEEDITGECPLCGGSGEIERFSDRLDKHVEIECPCCSGSGEVTTSFYYEIEEHVEVEDEVEIAPYVEGYKHLGHKIVISVDLDYIKHKMQTIALELEGLEIDNRMSVLVPQEQ